MCFGVIVLELFVLLYDSLLFVLFVVEGGFDVLKVLIDVVYGYGFVVLLEFDYVCFGSGIDVLCYYVGLFFYMCDDLL